MKFNVSIPLLMVSVTCPAATPELPFTFVENQGQVQSSALFLGRGQKMQLELSENSILAESGGKAVQIDFVGASARPALKAEDNSGAVFNFFAGRDSSRWRRNLPGFRAVRFANVWPGVDLVFRADGSGAIAEYHVRAAGDAAAIRLHFSVPVAADKAGGLNAVSDDEMVFPSPEVFLENSALPSRIRASYLVRADNTVSVNLWQGGLGSASLQPMAVASGLAASLSSTARAPYLLFSGYFGGTNQDNITAVAVSTAFNVIVAGWTASYDLPANGVRRLSGGGVDAFVASFSPVGGQLVYCTYLGGSGDDRAFGLAVDQSQNTYITGWTSSANFPVVGGVQSRLSGARDAFVTKLNATGTAIVYSTYLGGSGVDVGNAISVDSTGSAVIVGDTTSANLAFSTGAIQTHLAGGQDVFVAKLNPAGNALTLLTWLGGSATDHGTAVRFDPSGNLIVAGGTYSRDFPVTSGLQTVSGGGQDGFVTKLSGDGKSTLWSTYLGGSGGSPGAPEQVNAIAVSAGGNVAVAGVTSSLNFPVKGDPNFGLSIAQPTFGGGQTDGFLTRLRGASGEVVLSTYIGGSQDDAVNAMQCDGANTVYLTGYTYSTDFPVYRGVQSSPGGAMDAFFLRVDNSGQIVYSTYLGGSANDSGNAIALDSMASVVIAGSSASWDFPVTGSLSPTKPGIISAFLTKFAPSWSTGIALSNTVYYDPWHINGFNGLTPVITQGVYGQAGDILVTGDWDGTGVRRIGAFRNGLWILDTNGNGILDGADKTVSFGQAGDQPISGYFDGTGRPQLGLYRNGYFILDLSGHLTGLPTGNIDANFPFGQPGDVAVAGDWDGTGTTKIGVFRNGTWLLDLNGDRRLTSADPAYTFGQAGDVPVVGSWDSTGSISRIGVYRAGYWILDFIGEKAITNLGVREMYFAFGGASYKPLVF